MGTVGGLRTRRYHGLLAVAVDGPGSRMLGLASLDPVLVLGDARVRLATHEWGAGTVDPSGYELLVSFDLDDGVPRWRWQLGGVVLERELAMAHGSPTVGVVHRLVAADRPVRLELHAALHLARACTASGSATATRRSRRRTTASCSRAPTASPAPASSPAASGIAACGRARRRPAA